MEDLKNFCDNIYETTYTCTVDEQKQELITKSHGKSLSTTKLVSSSISFVNIQTTLFVITISNFFTIKIICFIENLINLIYDFREITRMSHEMGENIWYP